MSNGVPCMWMRGGTSKGAYFLAEDLPSDVGARDAFLLRVMGSPDARQIDGMGGGDPLTSKVAVVCKSQREGIDVDYHFLQVAVDQALVSGAQNCGNILAGVGPFAIERGLVAATGEQTRIAIHMENTGQTAVAAVQTPNGEVTYDGETRINGVPGAHAPVELEFRDTAGSSCGALLPTGNPADVIEGVACTLIDNGMPCVIFNAADVGATGYETREELDSDAFAEVRGKIEAIRLAAGPMMNLGDVAGKTVPKMTLVARPRDGGAISARVFIPHRAHASIGVLGAVTVATACCTPGAVPAALAQIPGGGRKTLRIEHASGGLECMLEISGDGAITSTALVRTARKLMDGRVFA